jgi:hypothetical protein
MKLQAEQPVLGSRLVQLGLRVSRGFQRANNLDLAKVSQPRLALKAWAYLVRRSTAHLAFSTHSLGEESLAKVSAQGFHIYRRPAR